MARPLKALVHTGALVNNLLIARRYAPATRLMAVIKANGYGHGLLRVARALEDADGFAVLSVEEAVRLREAGFEHPVLLLEGVFEEAELQAVAEQRLSVVVHNREQIAMLKRAWSPVKIHVFLKVNTGMNRLGFPPAELPAALAALRDCALVGRITLMTHFATADEPAGIRDALARFRAAGAGLDLPTSLANSAALLRYPETHGDWARPGIMLYGASPFAETRAADLGLEPAMSLVSQIIAVQAVAAGEGVGYGASFVADRAMRVGIVACGYADGYPRHAPTGTPVLVAGCRTRTVGRVSMDMLAVDLSALPEVGIGAPVTLWGEGLPVEEVARAAGTISYELLTGRAERVPVADA